MRKPSTGPTWSLRDGSDPRPLIARSSPVTADECVSAAVASSAVSGRSAFPPVVRWLLPDHGRCNLHLEVVAELPLFLFSTGVLEENPIDFERLKFAGTVAIDGVADKVHKIAQLGVVVIRNRARRLSLRLSDTRLLTGSPSRRPVRASTAAADVSHSQLRDSMSAR